MDTEMSEAGSTGGNEGVKALIASAHRLVQEDKPSQALQAVLTALQKIGGNSAVAHSLQRAREMYRKRLQETTGVDKLASLFAECVIADVESPGEESPTPPIFGYGTSTAFPENSILAESGRMQIVLDAFADGSSFICLQCGGLVSVHRKDEHYAYWCGKI